ncbi:MAG: sigma-54-dependent Fis family transcriptional regulator, partial [FCB group bacterium]|nr:sigma-54-dependent Fis family transcriptional regulator [FCB group bacterium]
HIPPLKERRGDILLLADNFIQKYTKKIGKEVKGISSEAAELLVSYNWPGNVRELENIIERAVVLTNSQYLNKDDLSGLNKKDLAVNYSEGLIPLAEMEKKHIKYCLDQLNWNISATAEKLGIHRNTLRAKIKEYHLSPSN